MMKYLIVVLVVLVVGWLMLRGRSREPSPPPRRRGNGATPKAMVQCSHCGVHLPRSEAVEDRKGLYCSEAHRLAGPS